MAIIIILLTFFLCWTPTCSAGQWSGSLELGERLMTLESECTEGYDFLRAYLRYRGELEGSDYWYLRLDYQLNDYYTRKIFDSRTVDFSGSLVHFLSPSFRVQLEARFRYKEYPHAGHKDYQSFRPGISARWDLTDSLRLEGEYNFQEINYSEEPGLIQWSRTFVLGGRQRIGDSLTIRGRYRASWEFTGEERLRHSLLLGFNYRE